VGSAQGLPGEREGEGGDAPLHALHPAEMGATICPVCCAIMSVSRLQHTAQSKTMPAWRIPRMHTRRETLTLLHETGPRRLFFVFLLSQNVSSSRAAGIALAEEEEEEGWGEGRKSQNTGSATPANRISHASSFPLSKRSVVVYVAPDGGPINTGTPEARLPR
jgi:hypothetical protein